MYLALGLFGAYVESKCGGALTPYDFSAFLPTESMTPMKTMFKIGARLFFPMYELVCVIRGIK